MRTMAMILAAATLGACQPYAYEPEPTTAEAWRRRQEAIERREADRLGACRAMPQGRDRDRRCDARPGENP